eukprot:TCONS_00012353-protein
MELNQSRAQWNCSSKEEILHGVNLNLTLRQQEIISWFSFSLSLLACIFNFIIGFLMYKQRLYRKKSSWSTLTLIASEWLVSLIVLVLHFVKHKNTFCDEGTSSSPQIIIFTIVLETIPTGVLLFTAHDRYIRLKDLINYSSNFNAKRFWMHYCCSLLHSVLLGFFFLNLPNYWLIMPWILILYFLVISIYGCTICLKSYEITKNHVHEYSTRLLNKLRKLMRLHVQQMLFLFFCHALRVLLLAFSLSHLFPMVAYSVLFNTSILLTPFISFLNALTLILMDPCARRLVKKIFSSRNTQQIAPVEDNRQRQHSHPIRPPAVLYFTKRNNPQGEPSHIELGMGRREIRNKHEDTKTSPNLSEMSHNKHYKINLFRNVAEKFSTY